jgi:hypothetical protein
MAEVFVQWKGTSACVDFYCDCEKGKGPLHLHADFMYFIRCPYCKKVWGVPTTLQLAPAEEMPHYGPDALVRDIDLNEYANSKL